MPDLQNTLQAVKRINWSQSAVSFYVIKRKLIRREAQYEVLQVNVDDNLRRKIKSATTGKIDRSNQAIEYDFNTADQDDDLLGISTAETDLQGIIDTLLRDDDPPTATRYEELVDSWVYLARLDVAGNPPLFAVRRVSESWSTKKVHQLINMIFQGNMLVDLDQQEIFRIDGQVDFFAYNGTTFIANKKNFETALNFREGMEKNRDEIVEEFSSLRLFEDVDSISSLVGNNIRRLRKLSQVKQAGYYRQEHFLINLKRVNEEEGWGITYSAEGKIMVNEDDIDTVLRVLNNDRLTSKINEENFDVDVKHKLGSSE
jgi:hypothetical protein